MNMKTKFRNTLRYVQTLCFQLLALSIFINHSHAKESRFFIYGQLNTSNQFKLTGKRQQTGTDNFTVAHSSQKGIGFEHFREVLTWTSLGIGLDYEPGDGCDFILYCEKEAFSQIGIFTNVYLDFNFNSLAIFTFGGIHYSAIAWDPNRAYNAGADLDLSVPGLGLQYGLGFDLFNRRLRTKVTYKINKLSFKNVTKSDGQYLNKWNGELTSESIVVSLGLGI